MQFASPLGGQVITAGSVTIDDTGGPISVLPAAGSLVGVGTIASGNSLADLSETVASIPLDGVPPNSADVSLPPWAQAVLWFYAAASDGGPGSVAVTGKTSLLPYSGTGAGGLAPRSVISKVQPVWCCPVLPSLDPKVTVTVNEITGATGPNAAPIGHLEVVALGQIPPEGLLPLPPVQYADVPGYSGQNPTILPPGPHELIELALAATFTSSGSSTGGIYISWTDATGLQHTSPRVGQSVQASPGSAFACTHPNVVTIPGPGAMVPGVLLNVPADVSSVFASVVYRTLG